MIYGLSEYERLKFLEEYNFRIHNNSNGKYVEILCIRNDCCIIYHEWPQFGDFNVFISNSIEDYKKHIYQKSYGINWLVGNVLPQYQQATNAKKASKIELIEFYIRNQVKNEEDVFGVLID